MIMEKVPVILNVTNLLTPCATSKIQCTTHKNAKLPQSCQLATPRTKIKRSIATVSLSSVKSSALFLTPLIKQNKTNEARNLSLVDPRLFLNVTSYSGFLTVDERYNSNLFFWYFPKPNQKEPKNVGNSTTPWIIWLQGGPGATSLVGLFSEMGPFEYIDNQLKLREFSWSKHFSMVFIDNPVGAGFSFTNSRDGYSRNMDMYSENLYRAVKQLVALWPELGAAPLFVAGESYAGRYVPALARDILHGAAAGDSINLQGIIMGNPILDRDSVVDYTRVFYNWGLVDSQGALAVKSLQEKFDQAIKNGDSLDAYSLRDDVLNKLQEIAYKSETYNLLKDNAIPNVKNFIPFVTSTKIREAIHVGDAVFDYSNADVHIYLKTDFIAPVSTKIDELLEKYRVLIYCGQLDLTTPCVLNAEARRRKWRWSRRDEFLKAPRTPWWLNNSVVGYVKSGGGFTEIQVNGAGHLVPIDKPVEAVNIIYNFITEREFTRPSAFEIKADDTPNYEEYTDLSHYVKNSDYKSGFIASVVVNVLLMVALAAGVVMFVRWRRQNDVFYSPLNDGILTMS
ncbi:venom serine carboxypeptidase-like [Melitaea cinxia]|uniref:venom serine carboxypeptidase-like n=1 Tax=Melitaea cinxia TaxID=113334 RepID=UPI001E270D61|nr:venom serine carboxypeptidase-like [Melitaea cinxia]